MFFVYGLAKNEQENINKSDERDFKELANLILAAFEKPLGSRIEDGKYIEVMCDAKN